IALAIATFDDPTGIAPTIQWGTEAKLPYVDGIPKLPSEDTMADIASAPYLAELVSYQHPDHDTDQWPPEERP
ncbi:MAG: GFA family protein, partial [Mesorhizobium sp.]